MTEKKDRIVKVQFMDTEFSDFRVNFEVEKDFNGEPNNANIEIYGLSRETTAQALMTQRDTRVRLIAGYESEGAKKIFDGQPIKDGIEYERDGEDVKLKIEAQGGREAFQKARVSMSFDQVKTYHQIVNQLPRSSPLFDDTPFEIDPGIPNGHKQLPAGMVYEGRFPEVADQIAEDLDCDWSFQNGTFVFIHHEHTRPMEGPKFSHELGNLIEAPRPTDNGIEVTVLMEHVDPGMRFKVADAEDKRYNGAYKALKVRYQGDSGWDNPFYSVIEGRRL